MRAMNLEIETDRLHLRPLQPADVDHVIELRTNPDVMKFIAETETAERILERFANFCRRSEDRDLGVWCVNLRGGDKIGTCILLPLPVEEQDTRWNFHEEGRRINEDVEVGYMLKPAFWGKGFATEITRGLLRFAFEQTSLTEIVAVTDPENAASQNVLRKSGLRDIGMRRAYAQNLPGFSITRDEWQLS